MNNCFICYGQKSCIFANYMDQSILYFHPYFVTSTSYCDINSVFESQIPIFNTMVIFELLVYFNYSSPCLFWIETFQPQSSVAH